MDKWAAGTGGGRGGEKRTKQKYDGLNTANAEVEKHIREKRLADEALVEEAERVKVNLVGLQHRALRKLRKRAKGYGEAARCKVSQVRMYGYVFTSTNDRKQRDQLQQI